LRAEDPREEGEARVMILYRRRHRTNGGADCWCEPHVLRPSQSEHDRRRLFVHSDLHAYGRKSRAVLWLWHMAFGCPEEMIEATRIGLACPCGRKFSDDDLEEWGP